MKIIIENNKIFLTISGKKLDITEQFKQSVTAYKRKNNVGIINISTDDKYKSLKIVELIN